MSVIESMLNYAKSENILTTGLTDKEAKSKLQKHGLNILAERKKISPLKILFQQFTDLMVIILMISTVISGLMGEMTEAVTIIAIVVVNAIMGFVQEFKTEKTMEALKSLAAPSAKVIRNEQQVSIPAEEIVPGDVLVIEAGDRIAADAAILESSSLHVDESLLTGESVPVEKNPIKNNKALIDPFDKKSSVYMGTVVTGGRAKAVVYATGMKTEMGHIADMIQNIEDDETPLQRRLAHLGKFIAVGCLLICAIVSIAGVIRGEKLFNMLLSGISLAVAAVPEGLPAIVTISLALGVQRMLKRNALIRKLPAVETLGCASIICSDKTGTLTENKMTVRKIYAAGYQLSVTGNGYNLEGDFLADNRSSDPLKVEGVKLALEIGALCNNSVITRPASENTAMGKIKSIFSKQDTLRISGDPTEIALTIAAAKAGITQNSLNGTYQRIDELPFDSDRKCMSIVCKSNKGEVYVFTKGAPDMIIDKCNRIMSVRGIIKLDELTRRSITRINDSMANNALRVMGLAFRKLETGTYNPNTKNVENDLIFVGLMGMIDPPRKEAIEAVQKCRLAGIKPIMITGDHKLTATAIARELNIYCEGDNVLTGAELDKMNESQLENMAPSVSVYARVSPKHKLMIVRVLKKLGHIVAMTGDGVNDAPAVKEADIGVSMGITGTDVTKEASSMVLLDDNFATIVAAVEEGRVIYNNIRKFIRYMLACNLGEVLTMFLGMIMWLPIPLLPIQILWVNLVTDGLPAIALGLDPAENDIMMRKPRGAKDHIFSHGLLKLIVSRGIFIGLSTLGVFVSILYFVDSVELARTGAFMTLVMTQLIHVFECKSETKNIFEIPIFNNIPLILAVLCSLVMILGVVYIPALQTIFETVPLGLNEWLLIMGFTLMGPVLSSLLGVNRKRHN
ncbi:calcium-translocating P-type ATPase, SERCA-type [Ruminiclostridium cellobioparum]|uniref:ATPase, P-type (Transporting), HAD superfamily, subfamily IC n=1 Tax=Ruminiclostridium cellobioparum subsp. termitidis CT1112 TaxID=1195236 RepID=S0FJN6_RUMCE|nr:calcium-translocating P-type ATPase, SERCA-type [Ruminiclostridium cellobioparum]EMS71997.1 ATPase, P-type (transporting), HAD superfamily, subfamily IC [Ruminiclostridium cellobioparum subsp. termitidis CT1112]